MIKKLFIYLIRLYQRYISPLLGNRCRFYPTCSAYAIEALQVHGVLKGSILAAMRLMRCNPLFKSGIDPVPPKNRWKNN